MRFLVSRPRTPNLFSYSLSDALDLTPSLFFFYLSFFFFLCYFLCFLPQKTGFLRASKVAPGDSRSNMTLLCAAVTLCGGQLHERTLCAILLAFQAFCATFGLIMRYGLGSLLYGWRNIFAHEAA